MAHTYRRDGSRVGSTRRVRTVLDQSRGRKAGEMGRLWPKAFLVQQEDTEHRLWVLLSPRLCAHIDIQFSLPKPPQLLVSFNTKPSQGTTLRVKHTAVKCPQACLLLELFHRF